MATSMGGIMGMNGITAAELEMLAGVRLQLYPPAVPACILRACPFPTPCSCRFLPPCLHAVLTTRMLLAQRTRWWKSSHTLHFQRSAACLAPTDLSRSDSNAQCETETMAMQVFEIATNMPRRTSQKMQAKMPTEVPLWFALQLKQRQLCTIRFVPYPHCVDVSLVS